MFKSIPCIGCARIRTGLLFYGQTLGSVFHWIHWYCQPLDVMKLTKLPSDKCQIFMLEIYWPNLDRMGEALSTAKFWPKVQISIFLYLVQPENSLWHKDQHNRLYSTAILNTGKYPDDNICNMSKDGADYLIMCIEENRNKLTLVDI